MSKKGQLFVIEGADGSGKQTQTKLIVEQIRQLFPDRDIIQLEFPNYGNPSSVLVEEYLSGAYQSAEAYAKAQHMHDQWLWGITMMYALDRVVTFMQTDSVTGKSYRQLYDEGAIFITDRYTTSSMLHQAPFHSNPTQYIRLLKAQEYGQLGLPEPTAVFYLHVTPEQSLTNIQKRNEKMDIMENMEKLTAAYTHLQSNVMSTESWITINCMAEEGMRAQSDIKDDILAQLLPLVALSPSTM